MWSFFIEFLNKKAIFYFFLNEFLKSSPLVLVHISELLMIVSCIVQYIMWFKNYESIILIAKIIIYTWFSIYRKNTPYSDGDIFQKSVPAILKGWNIKGIRDYILWYLQEYVHFQCFCLWYNNKFCFMVT